MAHKMETCDLKNELKDVRCSLFLWLKASKA